MYWTIDAYEHFFHMNMSIVECFKIGSEFEGVFLCQQLKLKTSLSHIMAMQNQYLKMYHFHLIPTGKQG